MYRDEELRRASIESNEVERIGRSEYTLQESHLLCAQLARTAAEEKELIHPRVYHQILLASQPHNTPGRYRQMPVEVAGRVISNLGIEKAMDIWWDLALVGIEEDNISTFQHHVIFESIHPFLDGNGRVGRLSMWGIEMALGRPITIIHGAQRAYYFNQLDAGRLNDTAFAPERTGVGS